HISFTLESFHETMEAILPNLDEPLADASLLPTYLVSTEAKKHVTVVLDGDGADELFYGYDTFPAYHASLIYQKVPAAMRRFWEQLIYTLPTRHTYFSVDFRLKSFLRGMPYRDEIRNQVWIGSFHDQELRALLTRDYQGYIETIYEPITRVTKEMQALQPLERLSLVYLCHYLQGDILQKIDRATMYASLEARTPFLDPRLVSFVLQLAEKEKYSFPKGKRLLRSVMSGRIPDQILKRKKQGFGIPLGAWLRGPLRDCMQATLAPDRLEAAGIVNPTAVTTLIEEHLGGQADHRKKLWTLMVLHWWQERWVR
ncbi:MAG: asparagine synthetase B family protein, partial [Acidobacteriota bacterium]